MPYAAVVPEHLPITQPGEIQRIAVNRLKLVLRWRTNDIACEICDIEAGSGEHFQSRLGVVGVAVAVLPDRCRQIAPVGLLNEARIELQLDGCRRGRGFKWARLSIRDRRHCRRAR